MAGVGERIESALPWWFACLRTYSKRRVWVRAGRMGAGFYVGAGLFGIGLTFHAWPKDVA